MNDHIFVPSFGNRPHRLIGRNPELEALRAALAAKPGSKKRATLIIGQRGTGKTVLLLELAECAHASGFITANPTVVHHNMLERINEKLLQDGNELLFGSIQHPDGINTGAFSIRFQSENRNRKQPGFEYTLEQICREAEKHHKGVLILIDEVRFNDKNLKRLIIAYQELAGKGMNVALVMAGLPTAISGTLNNDALTFLNLAYRLELQPIRTADISAYYDQCFHEIGLNLDRTAIQHAASETWGSPYLMQLIGHYLTLYADEQGNMDKSAMELALLAAKTEYMKDICGPAMHGTSAKDRALLCAMLEDSVQSQTRILAERLQVANSHVQTYKKRLIDAGLIHQVERGVICYNVPMLREYLTIHYSNE